ncbi:nickel-responsive transcriptional regulator NikR [Sphingobium mellinum]|uniref:nickel-responsive transcriptional regulator NikR n=1 Tax=Sphingobium mellinum TaxID=1387166 RepID=UPI0030EB521C
MQRVTISIDDTLSNALDEIARERLYGSRSEAVRDLVRDGIERWRADASGDGHCVANLSYMFDRRVRALPQRIAEMQHAHHDIVGASTVLRLDHFHSFETIILKGAVSDVRSFANRICAERGVRFGSLNMLSVSPTDEHTEDDQHVHEGHQHFSPLA